MLLSFAYMLNLFVPRLRGRANAMQAAKEAEAAAAGPDSPTHQNEAMAGKLMRVCMTRDFVGLFSATLVTWSLAVLFVAHGATMGVSAGLDGEAGKTVRFAFYTCGTVGRLLLGPVTDMKFVKETLGLNYDFFCFLSSATASFALVLLMVSGSTLILPAAVILGLSFGGISTLVPLSCRAMSVELGGTLYALSKIGCMLLSNAFIKYGSGKLEEVKYAKGVSAKDACIGPECYTDLFSIASTVCLPLTFLNFAMWMWAYVLESRPRAVSIAAGESKKDK